MDKETNPVRSIKVEEFDTEKRLSPPREDEGLRLMEAFININTPEIRAALTLLAEALSKA